MHRIRRSNHRSAARVSGRGRLARRGTGRGLDRPRDVYTRLEMKNSLKLMVVVPLIVIFSLTQGCRESRGTGGVTQKMKTYYFGRFLVSVPEAMGTPKKR